MERGSGSEGWHLASCRLPRLILPAPGPALLKGLTFFGDLRRTQEPGPQLRVGAIHLLERLSGFEGLDGPDNGRKESSGSPAAFGDGAYLCQAQTCVRRRLRHWFSSAFAISR
jgi:hypothetical protein